MRMRAWILVPMRKKENKKVIQMLIALAIVMNKQVILSLWMNLNPN
jgi:hypothetical protein